MIATVASDTSGPIQDPFPPTWPPLGLQASRRLVLTATGARGVAPGLATFERAAALGAGAMSVELRATADGHPVLLRCSDLRGVSDAAVRYPGRPAVCVEDLTWAELARLSIWLSHDTSTSVTPLAAVLVGPRTRAGLVLDLPIGPRAVGLDQVVVRHLRGTTRARPLAVRTRDVDALGRIRSSVPGVTTLARLGASAARYSLGLLPRHVDGLSLPSGLVDRELLDEASSRGLMVIAERPSTTAEARRVLDLGILALEVVDDPMLTAIRSSPGSGWEPSSVPG